MTELFVMRSPKETREIATWDSWVDLEEIHCPLDSGHQRGGKRIGELTVEPTPRGPSPDFVWTWLSDCLIGRFAASVLLDSQITGFKTHPVRVATEQRGCETVFGELVVTGWGGIAHPASGVRLLQSCPGCGLLTYSGVQDWGKLFDSRQWDGSDLFMIWPLPRFIIATERVISLIERKKLTGVQVVPLAKMAGASEGLGPGRVSYWLDEHRLTELSIDPAIR
jgi:hypothetical protein